MPSKSGGPDWPVFAAEVESRRVVGAYYEQKLAELLSHVAGAMERFSRGELSALETDGTASLERRRRPAS